MTKKPMNNGFLRPYSSLRGPHMSGPNAKPYNPRVNPRYESPKQVLEFLILPDIGTYQHKQTRPQRRDLRTNPIQLRRHLRRGRKHTTRKRNHQRHHARRDRHLDLLGHWPIHRVLGIIRPIPRDDIRILLFIRRPSRRPALRPRHPPRIALLRLDNVFGMSRRFFVYAVAVVRHGDGEGTAVAGARRRLEGRVPAMRLFKRVPVKDAWDVVRASRLVHLPGEVERATASGGEGAGIGDGSAGDFNANVVIRSAVARGRVVGAGYGRRAVGHFGGDGGY